MIDLNKMKIAICGSLSFAKEMGELKEKLLSLDFEVEVPYSAVKILEGEFSQENINKSKEDGTFHKITIENNAIRRWHDVIKSCDYCLDIGPEGGDLGGNLIAKGTPEEIANNSKSYTGQYLKKALKQYRAHKTR